MNQILWSLGLILLGVKVQGQQGLEKIIVEKYYVSDSMDGVKSHGKLPAGSSTYRIYADMLPAYRFQAAYGIACHELRFATTTSFYNNEEVTTAIANEVPRRMLSDNTVMLDSWLSVGAAAEGYYGVLKTDDTSAAVINSDGCLQNANGAAGIPVKVKDGMYAASPMSAVTVYGLNDSVLSVFKISSEKKDGQVFSTSNGSWASIGGAIGPPPANRVLIAQVTTDGIFSFELNIQIGSVTGGTENYVARNPTGKEILFAGLTYSSAENVPSKVRDKHPTGK